MKKVKIMLIVACSAMIFSSCDMLQYAVDDAVRDAAYTSFNGYQCVDDYRVWHHVYYEYDAYRRPMRYFYIRPYNGYQQRSYIPYQRIYRRRW